MRNYTVMQEGKPLDITITWSVLADLDLCVFFRSNDGREGGVFSDGFRSDVRDMGRLDGFPYMLHLGDNKASMAGQRGCETVKVGRPDLFERIDIVVINYSEAVDLLEVDYTDPGGVCLVGDLKISANPTGSGHVYHVATIIRDASEGLSAEPVNRVITLREAYDTIPGFPLICE